MTHTCVNPDLPIKGDRSDRGSNQSAEYTSPDDNKDNMHRLLTILVVCALVASALSQPKKGERRGGRDRCRKCDGMANIQGVCGADGETYATECHAINCGRTVN